MAINIIKSVNQSSVAQPLTLQYFFACCYGGHKSPTTVLSYSSINGLENESDEDFNQKNCDKNASHSASRDLSNVNEDEAACYSLEDDKRRQPKNASTMSSSASNVEKLGNKDYDDDGQIATEDNNDENGNNDGNNDDNGKIGIISSCGIIDVVLRYDQKRKNLYLTVKRAREIKTVSPGGFQIKVVLLPTKKIRFSTKIRDGISPEYEELFEFTKLSTDDIHDQALRFRLYGCEKMRRDKFLGGIILLLRSVDLSVECGINLILESKDNGASSSYLPRVGKKKESLLSDMSSLAGSNNSMPTSQGPELLLGLAYNGTTGRLACEIVKGSFLKSIGTTRAPDSYVKLVLLSASGQEMSRSKTTVRRSNPNPLFRETFMFQIPVVQLADVTLVVNVLAKKAINRKESIGSFTLGLTNSGDDEYAHWSEMKEAKGEQVCRWHNLLDNPS